MASLADAFVRRMCSLYPRLTCLSMYIGIPSKIIFGAVTGISHPITQIQLCKTAYLLSLYHAITASFNHSLNGFGAVRKGFGIQHKNPKRIFSQMIQQKYDWFVSHSCPSFPFQL